MNEAVASTTEPSQSCPTFLQVSRPSTFDRLCMHHPWDEVVSSQINVVPRTKLAAADIA